MGADCETKFGVGYGPEKLGLDTYTAIVTDIFAHRDREVDCVAAKRAKFRRNRVVVLHGEISLVLEAPLLAPLEELAVHADSSYPEDVVLCGVKTLVD